MPARVRVLQGEQRRSWHQAQSPAIPSHPSLTMGLVLSWEDRADKRETEGVGGSEERRDAREQEVAGYLI